MFTIILIVVFGVLFSLFATLNTSTISINLGSRMLDNVPLYLVVLVSIGIGVVIVSIYHLLDVLSIYWTVDGQEKEIKNTRKTINDLTKEIHVLELENTKLKTKLNEEDYDDDSI